MNTGIGNAATVRSFDCLDLEPNSEDGNPNFLDNSSYDEYHVLSKYLDGAILQMGDEKSPDS